MTAFIASLLLLAASGPLWGLSLNPWVRAFHFPDFRAIHTVLELFSVTTAFMIFAITWVGFRHSDSRADLFLANVFLVVGFLDLAHLLSYEGMPPFVTSSSVEKSISFWMPARMIESLGLLSFSLNPSRRIRNWWCRSLFLGAAILCTACFLWLGLFHSDFVPRTFVKGVGLTSFKQKFEGLVIFIHFVSILLLTRKAWEECRAPQILQVILNLLNNAYDAVENLSEKWVEVSAIVEGEKINISVTDSGGGIPNDVVKKLMQPFLTTKEVGKGTGIGLSISRGIAQQHNGVLQY